MIVNYRHIEGKKWSASTNPNNEKITHMSRLPKPIQRLLFLLNIVDDADERVLMDIEAKARRELNRVVIIFSTTNVYVQIKRGGGCKV